MSKVFRDLIIRTRFNEKEAAALARLSEAESRKPTELVRELVRRAAVQQGLWPVAVNEAGQPEVHRAG